MLWVALHFHALPAAMLEPIAAWACQFTPRVALEPPDALLIEVEGSLRYFGGEPALVGALEREAGETGPVGIGIPGTIVVETGLVKNANSVWLNGRPLGRDVEAALGRPVRFANDANCFALSEAADGAAAGCGIVFGVILGTGVGGGIVVGGRVLVGANAIAGEWGHNPLPWRLDEERPGPPCYCGKTGCIETFLSGPALARHYRERTGREMSPEAIGLAARRGDAVAAFCLELYQDRLARSLANIINVLDPDAVVLGGGVSNLAQLYESVPALVARYAFSDAVDTPIRRARHGDSSGVRGAAWLWPPGARSA
jgi:fructokinase